jgi:hypothetical protein
VRVAGGAAARHPAQAPRPCQSNWLARPAQPPGSLTASSEHCCSAGSTGRGGRCGPSSTRWTCGGSSGVWKQNVSVL